MHDGTNELSASQLKRREVYCHRQARWPACGFSTRMPQRPFAHLKDEAFLLGDRNEFRRQHQSMLGMAPAQQRLEAGDFLRADVDHRLIEQLELLVFQSSLQI